LVLVALEPLAQVQMEAIVCLVLLLPQAVVRLDLGIALLELQAVRVAVAQVEQLLKLI
jgi:hypothetical protein